MSISFRYLEYINYHISASKYFTILRQAQNNQNQQDQEAFNMELIQKFLVFSFIIYSFKFKKIQTLQTIQTNQILYASLL
ncbi:hypothetical protein pb186bvf_020966 [Paramecium bursaria]